VSLISDLLTWLQDGLQGLEETVSLRVREEPVLTVGLFRRRSDRCGRPGFANRFRRTPDYPIPLVLGGGPLPARPGVLCASCNACRGRSQCRR